MQLRTFQNDTGEGIVDFEQGGMFLVAAPKRVGGEHWDVDRWYVHVRVGGVRLFEYGSPCGTCGIVFRKLRNDVDRVTDADAVDLLGPLDSVPSDEVLRTLARPLAAGAYRPIVAELPVMAVDVGGPDDYFANEVARLSGPDDPTKPADPRTRYWRLGGNVLFGWRGGDGVDHTSMATTVALPIQDITHLDRERVEHWKRRIGDGWKPTALAVSVIDSQTREDPTDCPYVGQFLWAHLVLDGHHRLQAAAEMRVPVRMLSLWSETFSFERGDEALQGIERLCTSAGR